MIDFMIVLKQNRRVWAALALISLWALQSQGSCFDQHLPMGKIHEKVRNWLELPISKRTLNVYPSRSAGSTLRVNAQDYRIEYFLGQGHEANVYLISYRGRLAVAKEFHSWNQSHAKDRARYQELSTFLPPVLEVSERPSILVLTYREGVPLDAIFNPLLSRQFLTEQERQEIADQWVEFRRRLPDGVQLPSLGIVNVVYSFRDRTFYFIDPQ